MGVTTHVDAPAVEFVPVGQTMQPIDSDEELYLPAAQLVHAAAPNVEYFPAIQLTHATAPALGENVPGAQLVHADVPELGEKVPAAQLVHSDVPAEYFPAAQLGKCEG